MKLDTLIERVELGNFGGWVKKIPYAGCEGLALKVRAADSLHAVEVQRNFTVMCKAEDRVPSDEELNTHLITHALALDWNLTTADGEPLPCTPEEVGKLLTHPVVGRVFRDAFSYASLIVADRGAAELEADVKN